MNTTLTDPNPVRKLWVRTLLRLGLLTLASVLLVPVVFTPSTNLLAFVSSRTGNQEIYLLDIRQRIQHNLTRHLAQDDWPTWSPDGNYLAFWSNRDARAGIYIMEVHTGAVRRLPVTAGASATGLKWSPDGAYLAFSSPYGGGNDIYVAELNCTGLDCDPTTQRIISFDADDTSPEWSPDSTQLAFVSNWKWKGTLQVYIANRNGTHIRALTRARTYSFQPAWSPDGLTIAFVSNRENIRGWQIYLMAANCASILRQGCIPQVITANYMVSRGLDWSPDGRLIAFSSDASNEHNLFVVDVGCILAAADEPEAHLACDTYALTDQRGFNLHPAWKP